MIKVTYEHDRIYRRLEVSGHAEFDRSGKDLVCAAVSSVVFGLMNALDESGEDVKIKQLTNRIVIINESESSVIDDYFKLTMYQLKTIEESYGEYLKVERK